MAFQTSCVSAANIVTGLTFQQDVMADAEGRELVQHGSALFPIACYAENLKSYSVAWHWHEEFEYILAMKGPLTVDVNKTRLTLQTGQGVFINSGALHAVEPAEGRALLHSGVFQPRLIGGMDTVFWQKLIRPLLQPGTPPFFLLDEAVPWQRQVLLCLREAWKGVADESFDYENRVRYHLTAALRLLITQCVSGKVKVSDQEQIASELIREKALRMLDDEIPHGIAVVIDQMKERPNGIIDVDATIVCERDSHKGIIIGKGGSMLKRIGTAARMEIENLMDTKVNLKLWVKVRREWRDSDMYMKNYGYNPKEI